MYQEWNVLDVNFKKKWATHPDIELDHDVNEYREMLEEWSDGCRGIPR